MFIKILLPLLSISLLCSCGQEPDRKRAKYRDAPLQAVDCSNFKTGKFSFYGKAEDTKYLIDRNDSIQTEINLKDGHSTRTRIRWISDCTYDLSYIDESASGPQTWPENRDKVLRTTIEYATKDYCVFTAKMGGSDAVLNDTLWVEKAH